MMHRLFKTTSSFISMTRRTDSRFFSRISQSQWEENRREGIHQHTAHLLGITSSEWQSELVRMRQNTERFMKLTQYSAIHYEEAAFCVKNGIILDQSDKEILLRHAIHSNTSSFLALVSSYLKKNTPTVNLIQYWGRTTSAPETQMAFFEPIIYAGAYDVVAFFIASGGDVCVNSYTLNLLHQLTNVLFNENHLKVMEQLIATGAEVNAVDDDWSYSPLLRTISFCKNPEIAIRAVQILIKNGANPNLSDHKSCKDTALHKAAKINNLEIASYLLENPYHKVDINAINKEGCNAAHILFRLKSPCAVQVKPDIQFLQYLMDMGIALNREDDKGNSVLDYITEFGLTGQVVLNRAQNKLL